MTLGITWQCKRHQLAIQLQAFNTSFAMILTWCEPSNSLDIYEHHKESMVEDFLHQQHTRLGNVELGFNEDIFNLAPNDLQDMVLSMGGRELSECGLPQPQAIDNYKFVWEYRQKIVAVTLLTGGCTLHSTFKVPLDLYAIDIPI